MGKGGELDLQEAVDVPEADSSSPSLGGLSNLLEIKAKEKHQAVIKQSFFI